MGEQHIITLDVLSKTIFFSLSLIVFFFLSFLLLSVFFFAFFLWLTYFSWLSSAYISTMTYFTESTITKFGYPNFLSSLETPSSDEIHTKDSWYTYPLALNDAISLFLSVVIRSPTSSEATQTSVAIFTKNYNKNLGWWYLDISAFSYHQCNIGSCSIIALYCVQQILWKFW